MATESHSATAPATAGRSVHFMGAPFDLLGLDETLDLLRARTPAEPFAYVVTPNCDHVARLHAAPHLGECYESALLSWCDSRPLRRIGRMFGLPLPHLAGADMVERILSDVVRPGDPLVFVTVDDALLHALRRALPLCDVAGFSPPMGFEHDPAEMERCAVFIESHPARFVFVGVGSPRSELLVHHVWQRGRAKGLALCIGAALEFHVGRKTRAPLALRRLGMEWCHRLATEPKRLWRRYLTCIPPILHLLAREAWLRVAPCPPALENQPVMRERLGRDPVA